MKTNFVSLLGLGVAFFSALTLGSCSCSKDSTSPYPNALVTVKTGTDGKCFLQLDDKTRLIPENLSTSPWKNEVRAFTNYEETGSVGDYVKNVKVNWIDSILTKSAVPDSGARNDALYGHDRVDIMNSWVTLVEDGYLNLEFGAYWGYNTGRVHHVNLLFGGNPNDPYEVEFRHDACGDYPDRYAMGVVAFRLDSLPDTGGKTVKLTVKWRSFKADESKTTFDYCSRPYGAAGSTQKKSPSDAEVSSFIKLIE